MTQTRGVFVPAVEGVEGWISFSMGNGYELSISALYWDKIIAPISTDHPKSFLYNPQFFSGVQELVSLGVAEAPVLMNEIGLHPGNEDYILQKQASIVKNIISRESEDWTVLDGPSLTAETLLAESILINDYDLLHLHLINALPVPLPDTPLESIVAFRDKRRDEIERVHIELGRLASTYVGSEPTAQAIPRALRDLNAALSDVRRVYSEKWSTRFFHSIRASFMAEVLLPAAAFHYFNMPLDKAFLVGGGVAVTRSSCSSLFGKPNSNSPYSCLFDIDGIR